MDKSGKPPLQKRQRRDSTGEPSSLWSSAITLGSGRPNNVSVVNYLVSVVNYLAKTVPASDALSAIPAKTNCFGQITSVSAENYSFGRNSSISVNSKYICYLFCYFLFYKEPHNPHIYLAQCSTESKIILDKRDYFGQKRLFRPKETVSAKRDCFGQNRDCLIN